MNDTLFWILSGTLVAASVVAVAHRNARGAIVATLVATMALSGLFVQLDAVWLALGVVVVQGATVLVAALPVWLAPRRTREVERAVWHDILWGLGLALVLVVEMAWMLQRLEVAPFVDQPADRGGIVDLQAGDLMLPTLGVIFLLMSVAAVQALRREAR